MTESKKPRKENHDETQPPAPSGAVPAVPPPDDPLRRHEGELKGVDSAEAAALRAEAIRRTRQMPREGEPPPGKKRR